MTGPKTGSGSRLSGLLCLLVLCGILVAGLWPFQRPLNAVTWLGTENGVRFGDHGTVLSAGTFEMPESQEEAPRSLEIWLQPERASDSNTILAFSTPDNPVRFSLHQYFSTFLLTRQIRTDQHQTIGIEGIFRPGEPAFVTITSGPERTVIYVDGVQAGAFSRFMLARDFTGQLVIGTSPVSDEQWHGEVLGLALYGEELTAPQVVRHYRIWTAQGLPELSATERVIALYPFSERVGNVVHNAVRPGIDLTIPQRFSFVHQLFLKPFWKEYSSKWSYWQDVLVNIAGFIPLGFLFCAYWSSVRPIKYATVVTIVLGLAVSLTIEILQSHLPTRTSDTTDVITNTLGTLVGVVAQGSKAGRHLFSKIP